MFLIKTSFELEIQGLELETSKFDWCATSEQKRFQDFLNNIGHILNSVRSLNYSMPKEGSSGVYKTEAI